MTEISSITLRAERTFGFHVYGDNLAEIVRGLETGDDAMEVGTSVAKRMGLETIRISDTPGYVLGRLRALQVNEAFALVQQGVAKPCDIDKACRLAGGLFGNQGPFEWADANGLDNLQQELERLEKAHGERFRPNVLLAQHVKAGRTGKRAGRGVYRY